MKLCIVGVGQPNEKQLKELRDIINYCLNEETIYVFALGEGWIVWVKTALYIDRGKPGGKIV